MRIAIQIQTALLDHPEDSRPFLRDFSVDEIAQELLHADSEIILTGAPMDDQGFRVSLLAYVGDEPGVAIRVLGILLKQGTLAESPNALFACLQNIWRRICQTLSRKTPQEEPLDPKKQGEELDF